MSAIEVRNLSKQYRVYQKREGLWASLKGLFSREYKTVDAVRDVSFTIEAARWSPSWAPTEQAKPHTQAAVGPDLPVQRHGNRPGATSPGNATTTTGGDSPS